MLKFSINNWKLQGVGKWEELISSFFLLLFLFGCFLLHAHVSLLWSTMPMLLTELHLSPYLGGVRDEREWVGSVAMRQEETLGRGEERKTIPYRKLAVTECR